MNRSDRWFILLVIVVAVLLALGFVGELDSCWDVRPRGC